MRIWLWRLAVVLAGTVAAQAVSTAVAQAQGYVVAINWVDGNTGAPLGTCHVVAVHNPGSSPEVSSSAPTVYVDLACPREQTPVGIGVGVGF